MEVKEIMLLQACEGIDMLLSKGQIDDTYIQLLYFIQSLDEDNNLEVGLSDKKMEELLDEDVIIEPRILLLGKELFEKLKDLENSIVISIGDIDLEEFIKKLNED